MPRVKRKTSKKPNVEKSDLKKLVCVMCGDTNPVTNHYQSFNPLHSTGRLPYCKDCLKKMSCDSEGNIILSKFKDMLKMIDRPFLEDIYETSLRSKFKDKIGTYMKNIAMLQYKDLTWSSCSDMKDTETKNKISMDNFDVSDDLLDKWGCGYTPEEYYYFEKKWRKLIDNYGEKTALHNEGLITYIRFRVKEELATAAGHVGEAKSWADMANKAATAAKINVSQLSKSDISGGVELLPQLFEAVESKVGIIPILPKLKEQPYDDADLIIWCVVNYIRRLEDKPRVPYREIWNFYDQMLEDHYKQQGYNSEMIEQEKQKRNSVFRDLGKVYREPIYEERDD